MIIHLKNKQTLKIGNFYFKCSIGASGLTNKERQKLANVYQQYNLSMGTFDFGTNTGSAMAMREAEYYGRLGFPSSTSLYGFSTGLIFRSTSSQASSLIL